MAEIKTASDIQEKIAELQKNTPKKWKVQAVTSKKDDNTCNCVCVAYYDARIVVDHLNKSFGFLNWQREHFRLDGKEYCRLKVKNPETGDWLIFEDTGTKSKTDGNKGETSDSFKRAAVNVGIGRENYEGQTFNVKGKHGKTSDRVWSYPVDETGKRIWNLTLHIENKLKSNDMGAIAANNDSSILEQIESLGAEFPELLQNCENHAMEKGADSLATASDKQLASYLIRLQLEKKKKKEKHDHNQITPVTKA